MTLETFGFRPDQRINMAVFILVNSSVTLSSVHSGRGAPPGGKELL